MAVRAPEFPTQLDWVNTDHPVRLADLKGRVVLIEFWTSCCINCHHNLARLREVRARYGPELAIVAVHSGKFTAESSNHMIAQAAERYGLHHPCLNDRDYQVWEEYCVSCWPTVVAVDPEGKIAFISEGELDPDKVKDRLDALVEKATRHDPLDWKLREPVPVGELRYPSKIACGEFLYVSDTGHGRILEMTYDGLIQREFPARQPRGLALHGRKLYVADTEDHTVAAINLDTGFRTVLAGTGQLGVGRIIPTPDPRAVSLRSPWDLAVAGETLYIAMAGTHQIWSLQDESLLRVHAGNGREALTDGPLSFASFNQPSGLALVGAGLVVADSEASAIRYLEGAVVSTLVGTGLFDFGDQDGVGTDAQLQHALGVTYADGVLFIADSFNHKIKIYDPNTHAVRTLIGTGKAGHKDGAFAQAKLHEPEGLAYHEGKLYIADTNSHALRIADLTTRELTTLKITREEGPARPIQLLLPDGWHLQRLVYQGREVSTSAVPVEARDLEVYACSDEGLCSVARVQVADRVQVTF